MTVGACNSGWIGCFHNHSLSQLFTCTQEQRHYYAERQGATANGIIISWRFQLWPAFPESFAENESQIMRSAASSCFQSTMRKLLQISRLRSEAIFSAGAHAFSCARGHVCKIRLSRVGYGPLRELVWTCQASITSRAS